MPNIVEIGPKTDELREAERIVSLWMADLWATRPPWLTRMPDREDVDDLINHITRALEKWPPGA